MENEKRFFTWRYMTLVAICALTSLLFFSFFQYLLISPSGSLSLALNLQFLFGLILFPIFFGPLIAPFFLFSRRFRFGALRYIFASGAFWLATFVGAKLDNNIRMPSFKELAQRSAPLVQAIRSYEARHQSPPPDLESLVPEFIPKIPKTGMGAYPNYDYCVGEAAKNRYSGNPWVLIVHCPRALLNWDDFLYYPLQNYPSANLAGESIEKIADWGYLHE